MKESFITIVVSQNNFVNISITEIQSSENLISSWFPICSPFDQKLDEFSYKKILSLIHATIGGFPTVLSPELWQPPNNECCMVSGSRCEHFHHKMIVLILVQNVFYKKSYFWLYILYILYSKLELWKFNSLNFLWKTPHLEPLTIAQWSKKVGAKSALLIRITKVHFSLERS